MLGPLRLRVDGAEHRLGGRRDRAVLALLASNDGNPLSAERLVDEVWGESAPPSATGSLQVAVSRLRGMLDPDRSSGAGSLLLQRGPSGYELHGVDLDARTFSEAANSVASASPAPGAAHGRRGARRLARPALRRPGGRAVAGGGGDPAGGGPAASPRVSRRCAAAGWTARTRPRRCSHHWSVSTRSASGSGRCSRWRSTAATGRPRRSRPCGRCGRRWSRSSGSTRRPPCSGWSPTCSTRLRTCWASTWAPTEVPAPPLSRSSPRHRPARAPERRRSLR